MTAREERELQALVVAAWEHRDSPYLVDFVQAIVAWHERRPLLALEHEQDRIAKLLRLVREAA